MPDWSAVMISPDANGAAVDGAPLLRKEITLDEGHGPVVRGTLLATAHGVYEAYLNARPVGEDVLSPGWSSYEWRLRYREHDVTALLAETPAEGTVLGFALGNGWFRGRLGWAGGRAYYGDELGAFAQLSIEFADGHVQTVVTDESWTAGPSDVLADDLYDGQTIDARRRDDAWLRPGHHDAAWGGVHRTELDLSTLTPYIGPPVRRIQEVAPIKVWTSPSGRTLVDFGQNLVGWVRVRVQGPEGTTVTLRHAEVLEHDELGTRPLRSALATDRFVLSGGVDVFEPTFTFHGFRYAEVEGWPGELSADALTAVVVSSDLVRIGEFSCSDELVNQLHRNAVWGDDRQLPRRPHRLPAARRTARLDRRHRRLHPVGGLPLRRARLPARLAARRGGGAARGRRHGGLRHPRRAEARAGPRPCRQLLPGTRLDGGLERRGGVGAVGAVAGVRRPAGARGPVRLDGGARAPGRVAAVADRAVGHRLPVRGLAGPDRAARERRAGQGGPGCRGHGVPVPQRDAGRGDGRPARPRGRGALPRGGGADPGRIRRALRRRRRAHHQRRGHGVRAGHRVRRARRRRSGAGGRAAGRAGPRGRAPHPDRLRRHPVRHGCPDGHRAPRRRVRPAPAAGVPVLALPRDDGGDDGVGALGLDAAGRHHQPGGDDELQPLRARGGRRLAAPDGRGSRPAGARLRTGAGGTAARRRADLGAYVPADPHGEVAVSWSRPDGGELELDVTLPDGVTGVVRLPGEEDQEIGAGAHHLVWRVRLSSPA